jgi:5'-nucleotidase / UDP-sugar diphosphatase
MKKRADTFFFTVAISLCIILLAIGFGLGARSADDQVGHADFALTILHTNDTHAHDESFRDHGRNVGGLARIAYLVHSIKNSNKNALAVDAGDFFQGTMVFQKYKGEVEVHLFNLIGYDVVALGNHEFDDGVDNLVKQLSLASFPVISSNLDVSGEEGLARLIKPSIVKEVNGQKVAFVGAITPDLEHIAVNLGKARVKAHGDEWINPIRDEVAVRKREGINKIILVTHCGVELDRELADSLDDVDVIVGGHSHTRLEEPIWVHHQNGSDTAIVQTGSYGRALGKFDLAFDQQGRLIKPDCHYELIAITDKIKQDQAALSYVEEKVSPLLALRHQIDGVADGAFDNSFKAVPWDSAIGDLVCDALAEAGAHYGAKIAFENRGGIRARIEKGPISEEKLQEFLPFDNKAVCATVSGATLLKCLEHSLGGPLGGPFLDVHGLKIGYDPQKPRGARIVFAFAEGEEGSWDRIDPDKNYKIIVNDYTFNGGEQYDFKSAQNIVLSENRIADVMREYLLKHKHVKPLPPNRIVPLTEGLVQIVPDGHDGCEVMVSGAPAGARIELLKADAVGVDSLSKAASVPVPLSKPSLLSTHEQPESDGKRVFDLPQSLSKASFVAVVAESAKKRSAGKVLVSYPISLPR